MTPIITRSAYKINSAVVFLGTQSAVAYKILDLKSTWQWPKGQA